jgi:hypothetical protein
MSRIADTLRVGALVMTALAGLAITVAPAKAFQEKQVAPGSAAGTQLQGLPADPKAQLQVPGAAPGKDKGIDIRIPGLGKVGQLPKLDFGLDILYGAQGQDEKRREDLPNAAGRDEGIKVEGRIKHRF